MTQNIFKKIIFSDDFIENKDFIIISPGRQRLINNSKKNKIDWDFNQDIHLKMNNYQEKKFFIKNMAMEMIITFR